MAMFSSVHDGIQAWDSLSRILEIRLSNLPSSPSLGVEWS